MDDVAVMPAGGDMRILVHGGVPMATGEIVTFPNGARAVVVKPAVDGFAVIRYLPDEPVPIIAKRED